MVMNKYYTPTIEEFHVGFECEIKNNPVESIMDWWVETTIKERDSLEGYDVRVKYIDREDIESLGFEAIMDSFNEHIGENQYKATSKKGNFNNLKWLAKHDDKICLHFVDDFKDDGNNNCYVAFTIKNKSELKRVLKQIGYE